MKFIKNILLALVIATFAVTNTSTSQASSFEDRVLSLDTEKYMQTIKLGKSYLNNKNLKIEASKREKLESLIDSSEAIIKKLREIQDQILQKRRKQTSKIKDPIRSNLKNRNTYFTIGVNSYITNNDISKLFLEVAKEDDYFYYSQYGTARITTSIDPKRSKDGKSFVEKANFDISYRSDLATEYEVRDFIRKWTEENIGENDSDYLKVKKIHDFIVRKNNYKPDPDGGEYSIYHPSSILFGQGGVCNAYANLFELMASKAGLDSRIVTGRSLKNGEDHMWNMVKVDGDYYHIDTTWDDPVIDFSLGEIENLEDFIIYDYFLKSDEEIKKSRTIDEDKNRPKAEESYYYSPDNSKIEEVGGTYWVV